MLGTATTLERLRSHYDGETRYLMRVLLNGTSPAEANLALDALREVVPEKVLVDACNLREVLRALPSSPFTMHVDECALAGAAGLTRGIAAMNKYLADGITLSITTAGNLVLDIIVRVDGKKYFWNTVPVTDDFVSSEVLDHVVKSDYLLDEVIDLARCMGVVWYPKFYLSLEDWLMETAVDAFDNLQDHF